MITLEDLRKDSLLMPAWRQNRFFILVGGAILVSMFLVVIALAMYNSSGAAQLDLSRRAFQKVQSEASRDTADDQTYPSVGALDNTAFNSFKKLYDAHANNVKQTKAFDPSAMTDEALGLPSTTTP
jgi:hypothetical protein